MTGCAGSNPELFGTRRGTRRALRNLWRARDRASYLWLPLLPALGQLLTVVVVDDPRHVSMGLAVGRHTLVLLYALRTGIVRGQRFDHVVVVKQQQFAQVAYPAGDILRRIEGVLSPQLAGGTRHELHQSLRAFTRNCMRIVAALRTDHAGDEVGVHLAARAGCADDHV